MLDLAAVLALSQACAPSVAPETLAAIAHVESRFDTLAIGVNGGGRRPPRAGDAPEAIRTARRLLAQGANIDLGLAQINSDNLAWLGLSVEQAFDRAAISPPRPRSCASATGWKAKRLPSARRRCGSPSPGTTQATRTAAFAMDTSVVSRRPPSPSALPLTHHLLPPGPNGRLRR